MDGFTGHQLICRACLRIVESKNQSFGFIEDANGNLKDMIMCCVPEMDIYVSSNPIMCFPCIQHLVSVYNFKTRCLNTETIIRSYIQRNNLAEYNHVNLNCVVQELIRINNYFRDMHHRKIDGDKQSMEVCPQNPRGIPRIPYGTPQGIPGHFKISENQGKLENPTDHVAPSIQGVMRDLSPERTRNEFISEGQHILTHRGMEGQQRILPVSPIQVGTQDKDRVVLSQGTEENRDNVDGTNSSIEQDSNCGNQSSKPESESSGNSEDMEKKDERCSDEIDKTATSRNNNNSSYPFRLETHKENRPRLIIKICKNKITIPSNKNEDSSEKENEKMDVEMNEIEMPPPNATPFETYQSPDNGHELYQCSNCTFVTTHPSYYAAHQKICGFEPSEKKCPHCPHVTNRQYALNKHINTMHTKSLWYTCDFCPYRSTDSSCLRRHKRNVHPERQGADLVCRLCSYHCTTEYHLKKHMMKHEDSTLLQCQFCSYSTRDRSNFRKHIFIHNPKPHDCEFCDYKCVSPYQMKLHLKKMHHGVGMEDVDCRSEVSISEVVQDISAAIREAKSSVGYQKE